MQSSKKLIYSGFSKLNYKQRMAELKKNKILDQSDLDYLINGGLQSVNLAEKFIENSIGYFQLPLGVATNFKINNEDLLIPMAVEETSIIAAASKTAKWITENGFITAETIGTEIIGQIQFAKISDINDFRKKIEEASLQMIQLLNIEVASSLVERGGGVTRITVRDLKRDDGFIMAIVHIYMNPCEAMGANVMNQVCEYLKPHLEELTLEKVSMCILSNLVDSKITKAKIVINNIDLDLAEKIEEASRFAELDPYRAATNNKGVLNGVDPILIATGNDWRAVEAGMHAYACKDGQYRSITQWRVDRTHANIKLIGSLEAPIILGTVGGVTTLHPTAKLCMKIMKIKSANQLSGIVAAVGLAQNLGALKALTTVGIIEGHMKLHVKNLSLGAGATESEMPMLVQKLESILKSKKRITLSMAVKTLKEMRILENNRS